MMAMVGILIAVTKDLLSNLLPELNTSCEIIWYKIHTIDIKDFYVCAYYRPHVSDQLSLDQLNLSLTKVQEHKNNPTIYYLQVILMHHKAIGKIFL